MSVLAKSLEPSLQLSFRIANLRVGHGPELLSLVAIDFVLLSQLGNHAMWRCGSTGLQDRLSYRETLFDFLDG